MAEPGFLSLGELASAHFDQLNCFRQRTLPAQVLHDLPVANGLHCGPIAPQPLFKQTLGFSQQTALKHNLYSRIDPSPQVLLLTVQTNKEYSREVCSLSAGSSQKARSNFESGRGRGFPNPFRAVGREGLLAQVDNFECPDDPPGVVVINALKADRVEFPQLPA
jgi:hypothetical protein